MNAIRQEKEQIVEELVSKMQTSKSVVFVEYQGLTVADMENLRNDLRNEGVEFKIYKNKLVKIAAEKAGFAEMNAELIGPNAVAFANGDEVAAARIINKHAQQFDFIKFKTGVFEGKVVDTAALIKIANIPSRETLLTQIAAGLLQPITEVARGLTMLEESHVAG